jgi:hypothetical protein
VNRYLENVLHRVVKDNLKDQYSPRAYINAKEFLTAVMAEKSCCVSFCSHGQTAVAIFHIQDGEMRAAFDQTMSIYYENQARYGIILNVL